MQGARLTRAVASSADAHEDPRMTLRSALLPCAVALALGGAALPAVAQSGADDYDKQRKLTEFTYHTGLPRAAEQEAVVFELADLSFKFDPARKHMDGDAKLT